MIGLLPQEFGQSAFLVGPESIDCGEMVWRIAAEQDGRALPVIIAEIGAVLLVADQRGKLGIECAGHLGRIGQPLVLIGLQPAEAVADDDASAHRV